METKRNHLHTKVSLCVIPAHPNSAKEKKDVPDQRCSALIVKNMVISVVRPFVKGRRIRNLHTELTVSDKYSDSKTSEDKEYDSSNYETHNACDKSEKKRNQMKSLKGLKNRFQVDIVIKEQKVKATADTGSETCVAPFRQAQELGLPLSKTKMKIHPYASKSMKCCGYYTGTVRYGDTVANICLYVVKQDVETLLSGRLSEELGIIKFNQSPGGPEEVTRKVDIKDTVKASNMSLYPEIFTGVGTLKNHKVKLHIDSSVPPVAEPARPVLFHLREIFLKETETMKEQSIIEELEGPTL